MTQRVQFYMKEFYDSWKVCTNENNFQQEDKVNIIVANERLWIIITFYVHQILQQFIILTIDFWKKFKIE